MIDWEQVKKQPSESLENYSQCCQRNYCYEFRMHFEEVYTVRKDKIFRLIRNWLRKNCSISAKNPDFIFQSPCSDSTEGALLCPEGSRNE